MESHGTSWNPTEPHGIPQNLMESHKTSWNPTKPHGIPQNLMRSHCQDAGPHPLQHDQCSLIIRTFWLHGVVGADLHPDTHRTA
jgi:hypothetical protein